MIIRKYPHHNPFGNATYVKSYNEKGELINPITKGAPFYSRAMINTGTDFKPMYQAAPNRSERRAIKKTA